MPMQLSNHLMPFWKLSKIIFFLIFSDMNGDHCFSQCFSVHHEEHNQSDQLVLMAHCPAESAIKASSRPMQLELLLPQYS